MTWVESLEAKDLWSQFESNPGIGKINPSIYLQISSENLAFIVYIFT